MKKLLFVIIGSLALGIAGGSLFYWINHLGVEEHFVPRNMISDTEEIRESD